MLGLAGKKRCTPLERAVDTDGRLLWKRRYPFRALDRVGDEIIDNGVSYRVVSSEFDRKRNRIKTVLVKQ